MKKTKVTRDFDFYIDEYMYNCRSRKLRPKTMNSYEQTLRLFERWCLEEKGITEPGQVLDTTIRHYICSLQERGKYTFYSLENAAITYSPNRRRDYAQTVSTTTINNYIRNLKAFLHGMRIPPVPQIPRKRSSSCVMNASRRSIWKITN